MNDTVTIWTLVEWVYIRPDSNDQYPHVHQTFVTDRDALKAEVDLRRRKKHVQTEVLTSYMTVEDAHRLLVNLSLK